jgi:hypothetical protein
MKAPAIDKPSISWPRVANIVLGIWLFLSAFLFSHSVAQMTNTWIVGVFIVIFALSSIYAPQARYLNTALAVWLFISAFALPSVSIGTVWNNVIVALLVFVFSLMPSRGAPALRRTAAT